MTIKIYRGDDEAIGLTCMRDNVTFAINPAATVEAAIICRDTGIVAGPVICTSVDAGKGMTADWPNSFVVANFPKTITELADLGPSIIELQIDDGAVETFQFCDVIVLREYID